MNGESVGNSVLPIDYAQPFANIRGVPLWLLPSRLSPQDHAAIESLHARGRAAHHLADYAALAVLDDDQMPARHHRVICEHLDDLMADRYDELIVCTPPGSAKSTYTSHALASHFMGRWPRRSIILATHTADLSEKWSRKVRNTIASARHSLVFPDPGCQLSRDSAAVGRWATAAGGEFLAAGVGASILGFRADLCLTASAQVLTKTGYTSISNIRPGDEVLGYDESQLSTGYHRVAAVAERTADIIYRIHTADGRMVEATGNHPFYAGGRFVPADSLVVGDALLSSLPCHENDPCFGTGQADSPLAVGTGVLLEGVFQQLPPAANGEALRGVRRTVPPAQEYDKVLFPRLLRAVGSVAGQIVRALHSTVQAAQLQVGILFDVVQERLALAADGVGQQPELAGREEPQQVSGRQWAGVPRSAAGGTVHGQRGMRDLCFDGEPARAPRGRGFDQQRPDQHRDALPVVSHEAAWCGAGETTETTVARIEVVRGNARVFDIQVDTVANFFANGILVHNCVIDDPIGGFEQAQSITQLKKVQGWFETDLITRLKPRAKLVLICQRLSPNDLAGYLIERNRVNPTRRQRVLSLRMECEADDCDPTTGLDLLGRRQGERLWPEWFTSEQVEDARRDDFKWRTLYQQRPPSDSGSWVSTDDIQFRPTPPAALEPSAVTYGATDLALSVNTGDYTVHAVIAVTSGPGGDEWDIVHAERARVDTDASAQRIIALCETWRPLEWLIDDDNASKVFVNDVATRARAARVPVPWRPMPMRGQDKETRAAALRGQFKRRRIWLPPDAPFTGWLTRELLTFPNAIGQGVDDGVDCLALFGRRLSSMASPSPAPSPSSNLLKTVQNMCLEELYEDAPSTVTNRI